MPHASNEAMNYVVCRCEDVTVAEIHAAIASGLTTAQEVKFHTRVGMGFCQGRVCRSHIEELLQETGLPPEIGTSSLTVRLPVRPVALSDLAAQPPADGRRL